MTLLHGLGSGRVGPISARNTGGILARDAPPRYVATLPSGKLLAGLPDFALLTQPAVCAMPRLLVLPVDMMDDDG